MMDTFEEFEIEELPLGVPFFRKKVEDFLKANGLALEEVDSYLAVCDGAGEILAGGGIQRDTIKCVAVSKKARSAGLTSPLISRLISLGTERGHNSIRVFTKPENRAIFESLGFHLLAQAPQAILLESSLSHARPAEQLRSADHPHFVGPLHFKEPMSSCPANSAGQSRHSDPSRHSRPDRESPRCGIIVMNANPFTRGHRYLAEQALKRCDSLVVLVVHAEASRFSFEERFEMVRAGLTDLPGVTVCDAGRDVISKEVFPTYFIKNLTEASQVQMYLDIDLFARQVAPSYCCSVRFVGSEPKDSLTAEYNKMMHEMLPERGIEVVEIPRLLAPVAADLTGSPRPQVISASSVREIIDGTFPKTPYGGLAALRELVPETTLPYVLAEMACACLTTELETPLKPGLVGPDGPGAHSDMDMQLMQRGIAAIRPWFMRIAAAGLTDAARPAEGCGPVRPCGAIPPTPWAPPVHEATGGHAALQASPDGLPISSTRIRKALADGDVALANAMLGYRYSLHGVVVAGNKMGRTIGFPTANMKLYEPLKLIPYGGVYAVEVETLGSTFRGMCNIGVRPTVGLGNALTVETNIFDFNEDIYGLDITIRFLARIRDERRFDSLDALRAQLAIDKSACEKF